MNKSIGHSRVERCFEQGLTILTPTLVSQIEEALRKVGAFGEVRLVIHKGRLRFIQTVYSEDVNAG